MYGPLLYNIGSVLAFVAVIAVVFGAIWLLRPIVVRMWRSYHDADCDARDETHRIWEDRKR